MKLSGAKLKLILSLLLAITLLTPAMSGAFKLTAKAETDWITAEDISAMPETTIRYWFYESPELTELGRQQIEKFQEMYPNIKVNGSTAPDNTDNEMLMPYVTSRTNSNIHQSVNNEDLWYIDHGLLYPLSNFSDFEEVFSHYSPNLNYTWTDGKAYSISWYQTPMLMFYNKAMLESVGWDTSKAPETYSEFFDIAEKIKNLNDGKWMMAPSIGEEWWQWEFLVQPFYIAATGSSQVVNDDGKTVMFDNEKGVKALQFFETLFKNDYALVEYSDISPFLSGQIAADIQGSWNIRTIKENAAEGFEYIIGSVPIPDGQERGPYDTFSFVRNLCIIEELGVPEGEERDRVRRASWEFLKFLISDEQMANHLKAAGDLPSTVDLTTNEHFAPILEEYGEKMMQFIELGKSGVIGDMNSLYEVEIMGTMQDAYLQVVYGRMSAVDAIAEAVKKANQIIIDGR